MGWVGGWRTYLRAVNLLEGGLILGVQGLDLPFQRGHDFVVPDYVCVEGWV